MTPTPTNKRTGGKPVARSARPTALVFLRLNDEQAEDEAAWYDQDELCETFVTNELGARTIKTVRYTGGTATAENPAAINALMDAINDLGDTRLDYVVCATIDRLTRSVVGMMLLIENLGARGIKIELASGPGRELERTMARPTRRAS